MVDDGADELLVGIVEGQMILGFLERLVLGLYVGVYRGRFVFWMCAAVCVVESEKRYYQSGGIYTCE
jgi:hypothetical protein